MKFTKVDTQVDNELGNYHSTMETLIEGAVLAIIVVFMFLRDIRATIVTALALPLSVMPTFWAMDAIGFSLNLVSLLAITLVTGILVDDAIVEIENIVRHMRMGKSAYRASLEAADEIGLAVIAISLSIAAIFAPVSFMGGIAGQYFRQFGLTVAIAVMFSLLVARFITPVIAAYFMRAPRHEEHEDGAVMRFYTRLVRGSVRWRWVTLFDRRADLRGLAVVDAAVAVRLHSRRRSGARAAGGGVAAGLATRGHRPRHPRDFRQAEGDAGGALGAGVRRPDPRRRLGAAQGELRHQLRPQVEARGDAEGIADPHLAFMADMPDLRFWFMKDNGQRDLQLIVAGRDIDQINDTANQLASEMRTHPDAGEPDLDRRARPPGTADRAAPSGRRRSRRLDRGAVDDDPRRHARRHRRQSRQVQGRRPADPDPRRARRGGARAASACCRTCACRPGAAATTPLASVADFEVGHGPTAINRYDRSRRVTIEADLHGDAPLGEAVAAIKALPAAKNLPPGVEIRETGDVEIMSEVFHPSPPRWARG